MVPTHAIIPAAPTPHPALLLGWEGAQDQAGILHPGMPGTALILTHN